MKITKMSTDGAPGIMFGAKNQDNSGMFMRVIATRSLIRLYLLRSAKRRTLW